MREHAAIFCTSGLLSMLATVGVIRAARALDLFDRTGVRKLHRGRVPRLGGISILIATFAPIVSLLAWSRTPPNWLQMRTALIALLSSSACIFLVGLVDDLISLRARTKLSAQLAAALFLCLCGVRFEHLSLGPSVNIDLGWLAWPLTVLWITGVANALNFIDGLDGLAAGIAAITCLVIALIGVHTGQTVMVVLMTTSLGGICGFLLFNIHPARIFMGDGGSLFLGFLLGGSAIIVSSAHRESTLTALLPIALALGVPILDTFFSILRRALSRRSLFSPDRSHLHHRLVDLGFSQPQVVLIIHSVTFLAGGLGLIMLMDDHPAVLLVFSGVLLLLGLLFRATGSVRLRESLATLKANMAILRQFKEDIREFEEAQLLVHRARSFGAWWNGLSEVARSLQFSWIALDLVTRDGTAHTLVWRNPDEDSRRGGQAMSMSVPVPDRRIGPPLKLQIAARAEESLEVAGRRIMLFSRLMDAHGLTSLASPATEPVTMTPSEWRPCIRPCCPKTEAMLPCDPP